MKQERCDRKEIQRRFLDSCFNFELCFGRKPLPGSLGWYTLQDDMYAFTKQTPTSFHDFLQLCWKHSSFHSKHHFELVKNSFRQFEQPQHLQARELPAVDMAQKINHELFTQNNLVDLRNLMCPKLGFSVREICRTLLLLIADDHTVRPLRTYCHTWCDCDYYDGPIPATPSPAEDA